MLSQAHPFFLHSISVLHKKSCSIGIDRARPKINRYFATKNTPSRIERTIKQQTIATENTGEPSENWSSSIPFNEINDE